MSQYDVEDANNRQNRFYCLSDLESKYRSHAKEKIRRFSIEKFNGLVPESVDCMQIYDDITFASLSPIGVDEQNDKLNDSSEADFQTIQKKYFHISQEENFQIINDVQHISEANNFPSIDINNNDTNKDLKISENNRNKKNDADNNNKMSDNAKEDKDLFDNNRASHADTVWDVTVNTNILRKKTVKGKVQWSCKVPDGELSENDFEVIRKNHWDYIKERYKIDMTKTKNTKVTTKVEEFPAKNSICIQNENNDIEENENHNASEQTISKNNDVLFFDESVIKQIENQNNDSFVSDDFFDKECHFEINKAEQLNIAPQAISAFDSNSKKSKTEFKISSTQNLNFISATEKFVPNDINENKAKRFEILSQGASNPKSAERRNVLWFLKVIKWLSGIFDCGLLVGLIILWQFFNPLLTAVSITAFLVGLSIDTAIFVFAWCACSYLNNSVHELNNFSHLPENNSSQIEINNQNENKNQSPIPNSDNKDNNLAKQ